MEIRLPLTHGTALGTRARRAVTRALQEWNLTDPDGDIVLVATELVENVTRHTDADGELHVALGAGSLLIEVTDASPALPKMRTPEMGSASGRGLHLVQAIALRWGARALPHGKTVWAELPLPPAAEPGGDT